MRSAGILVTPIFLALVACGPPQNLDGASGLPASGEACNAAIYADLIGEPIEIVDSISSPFEVRVLAADAFVTKDFDPNRLTFTTTTKDTIGRVFCG